MWNFLKSKPISVWEKGLYAVLILGLAGGYVWRTMSAPVPPTVVPTMKAKVYETVSPQLSESFSTQKFLGRINSNAYAMVHPRRQGIIKDILVDVGDSVVKGQTLAVLLPPGVEGQGSANIARAYASLVAAQEALANAQNTSADSVAMAQQNFDNIGVSADGIRSQVDQQYVSGKTAALQVMQNLQKILFGENLRVEYANSVLGSFSDSKQGKKVLSMFKNLALVEKDLSNDHERVYDFLSLMEELTNEVEILYRDANVTGSFTKGMIDMNRGMVLASQSKILLAKEKIDNAELKFQSAQQNLNLTSSRAQGSLDAARTRLDIAQAAYQAELAKSGNIEVVSPFSGKITARSGEVGQMASPMKKLFEIVGAETSLQMSSGLEVIFGVSEDFISELDMGDEVEIIAPNSSSKRTVGVISRVGDSIDSVTQTATVHATFEEVDFLPHNSSVFVAVIMGSDPVFAIPSTSLKRKRSEHFVWIDDGDGGYVHLPVRVLAEDGEYSDVFSPHLTLTSEVVAYPSVSLWRVSKSWEDSALGSSLTENSDVE